VRRTTDVPGIKEIRMHKNLNGANLKGRDLVVDTGLCGMIMLPAIRQTEGDACGPPGST
jgi:hypothetical protein